MRTLFLAAAALMLSLPASADVYKRTGPNSVLLYGRISVAPSAAWKLSKVDLRSDQANVIYQSADGTQCTVQGFFVAEGKDDQEGQDFTTDSVMDGDVGKLLAAGRKGGVLGQRRWDVLRDGAGEFDFWMASRVTDDKGGPAVLSLRDMAFAKEGYNVGVSCNRIGHAADPAVGGDIWTAPRIVPGGRPGRR